MINKWTILLAALIGGFIWIRTKDLQDALKYSREEASPETAQKIDYYAGMVYYSRSDCQAARGAFTQLLTRFPTGYYAPKALLRYGTCSQELRKWDEAREAYVLYKEFFPEGKDISTVDSKYEAIKFRDGEDVAYKLRETYDQLVEE